jgi:hypothetical protein
MIVFKELLEGDHTTSSGISRSLLLLIHKLPLAADGLCSGV